MSKEENVKVTLYSTGCPKCKVLEAKLKQKDIDFEINSDVDLMQEKNFMELPQLEVDGKTMNFVEAVKWVNEYTGE